MWWSLTKSHQVLYRQAVSEALFDNCEDYQNIQNSSCKVGTTSSMDIIFTNAMLTSSLIDITSSMDIITTIDVDIITHQHHLSNSSPGSVAVASLLTWATELPPGLKHLKHLMYLVTDQSQVSTQVCGQLQVGGQACNVLLRSVPNITHLKLLLPTGQSRLLRCFLLWYDVLMNLCSETQLHLYNGPLELLHTYS